ncbi:MAG: hypothetical protein AB8B61_03720 [Cyclobacteriaceae bacterium]
MNKELIYLILIYLLIVGVSIVRVSVEETSYVSPDSEFYLKVSENLLERGEAIIPNKYPFEEATEEVHFSLWPLGYPLSILVVQKITQANLLWSSKIVNWLGLAFVAFLLYKHTKHAWFNVLAFGTYTSLEIISYSWSEMIFITCLFLISFISCQYKENGKLISYQWVPSLLFLFFYRYIGIVSLGIPFYYLVQEWIKQKKINWQFVIILFSCSLFIGSYLIWNKLQGDYMTGQERFLPERLLLGDYLINFFSALAKELSLAVHFREGASNHILFYGFCFFQISLISYCWFLIRKKNLTFRIPYLSKHLFIVSFFYLGCYLLIRGFMPHIETVNYRFLSPFSIVAFAAVLIAVSTNEELFKNIKIPITTFLILSLLVNLPKHFLISYFF